MMRCAPWAMAVVLSSIVSAGPAQAGRGHANVAIVATVGHPVFFNPSFHPFFFHPFFRPTFFVAAPVFAPPPVAFYPPPPVVAYYPPPSSAPYALVPVAAGVLLLHERPSRLQRAGVALVIGGLIVLGLAQ